MDVVYFLFLFVPFVFARSLIERAIVTAVSREQPGGPPPPYGQMMLLDERSSLLSLEEAEDLGHKDLQGFSGDDCQF